MSRCSTLAARFAAVALAAANGAANAQPAFPSKPIRIIVGSSAGALTDQATRMYAERMAANLKQPIVVENVAGASSILATRQVARAAPDGYTLLAAANTIVTVPHFNRNAGYAMKELTGVGELVRSPGVLVTAASSPYKSIADLVAAAKKDPGAIPYGSGGVGTTSHLPIELFTRQAGISLVHVPYKGVALAVPDVTANRLAFITGTATSTAELIRSGALRALATTAERRSAKFPDVPTFKELGYPDATFEIWIGLLAPAATPVAILTRLNDAMEIARNDPEVVGKLEAVGQMISDVRTPEKFTAMLRADEEKLAKLIREVKITVE
mgnify:CR=1 FL=1